MPSSEAILSGLAHIAGKARELAILWHVVLAATAIALIAGWRPTRRVAAVATALPLASASALAWAFGNPFNGLVLGAATAALVVLGLRLPARPVAPPRAWALGLGAAVLGYGWVYPHFLPAQPAWTYVYSAPVGLVPCPSLAIAIGFAILASGFASRAWSAVLATVGVFYAGFGALRLGVWLDLGLLVASASLLATSARRPLTLERA